MSEGPDFTWRDGQRIVRFGRSALADAPGLLGEGYALVTTPRARAAAPAIAAAAASVHEVGAGLVEELAAALVAAVGAPLVVGLGGGRVVDVAKAIAAARGARAAAVPTTLSAAEMTGLHRQVPGTDGRRVRPAIVLNDPALSASQPTAQRAASAANALGHAAQARAARSGGPVPDLAAAEAVRLLRSAYAAQEPDAPTLALGALLAGYAVDATGLGLHHVLAQTAVRVGGAPHAQANAALLPHALRALAARGAPGAGECVPLARELARLADAERLRDVGVAHDALEACVATALARPELAATPPPADREEVAALFAAAW
jgi:alcohol dehydrogenase class IV